MLQLKKFPHIHVSTREEARESRPHPEEPRFRLLARKEGSIPCVAVLTFVMYIGSIVKAIDFLSRGASGMLIDRKSVV